MREWDPNYKETKSVKGVVEETSAQVSENIQ